MKKSFYFSLALLCLCMLSSCGGDDEPSSGGDTGGGGGGSQSGDKHEWVDLGLTSGTLWATMNVGATKPEEYGDYFAWGETSTKLVYLWRTYKFGDYNKLTKYCTDSEYGTVDNITELEPSDDAAYVNWGSKWRMPTKAQFDELRSECDWKWTSKNGVNGFLVSSKRNSATLFLPAAGGDDSGKGSYGWYWTRTLCTTPPYYAYEFGFDSGEFHKYNFNIRGSGQSVRAVRVP